MIEAESDGRLLDTAVAWNVPRPDRVRLAASGDGVFQPVPLLTTTAWRSSESANRGEDLEPSLSNRRLQGPSENFSLKVIFLASF